MNTVAVFVEKITPRKKYIINHIIKNIFKYECLLIDDEEIFKLFNGPLINYSCRKITPRELHIIPSGFLDEEGIKPLNIQVYNYEGTKIFFKNDSGDFPFDIFSASFYLITRYEEYYNDVKKDEFGRYDYKNSIAYKNSFLQEPIIEKWCIFLLQTLMSKFPELEKNSFSNEKVLFTFDVDNAYAFKNKSLLRNLGGTIKALLKKDFSLAFGRYPVILKLKKDPYDTYDYILQLKSKFDFKSIFFFLVRNKGKYDRAVSTEKEGMKKLLEKLGKIETIGLHASVFASSDISKIIKEKNILENILDKKITSNRYHYLKFTIPYSYRLLINTGIKYDYSMGYHNVIGFRAGTSIPFKFFDLIENIETELTVVPFSLMDMTLMKYMNFNVETSIKIAKKLIDNVLNNNGIFISIWHNEFLSDFHIYKGWKIVFEEILEYLNEKYL